jgi:hypothetical protein
MSEPVRELQGPVGPQVRTNICSAPVIASRQPSFARPMDLDLERIAFGSVVGVIGAAVAAGAGREPNQQINVREEFDEIAGA